MRIDETIERLDRPVFSFEFFPPKTDDGFANLRTTLDAAAQRRARLRLGDLRRAGHHARPHAGHRQVDQAGPGHRGDGPLHVRGRHARGAVRDPARDGRVRRGQRAGPARRPAPGRGRVEAHRGRAAVFDRADRAAPGRVRVRRRRRRLPRGAPRGRERPVRPGVPEGQAGRRRQLLHHPAVLRQRVLLRLRGQGARHGHHRADHPGHHARDLGEEHQAHHRAVQVRDPARVRARAGPARGRHRGGRGPGRGLLDAAVRGPALARRPRHPLLHAEPLPRDARDPGRAARRPALDQRAWQPV